MLLFLSLTQFMGAVTILLVKIAFKTCLSSLSLILTTANSKRTVYMCLRLNPLPDDKMLDWSKLKEIADNICTNIKVQFK